MIEVVTAISLWELVKHTGAWVTNLNRANKQRKKDSVDALRKVVLVAQKTAIYTRQLADSKARDHATEAQLAELWTQLGFALEDLGIDKLSKRCRIKGRHWEDPDNDDKEYLEKADVGLERMQQLAQQLLHDISGKSKKK